MAVTMSRTGQANTDTVPALAFSPDGRTLATGSWDGAIKLWNLERGTLLWTSRQSTTINLVAFAPMDRCLPAAEMMHPSGSGTRTGGPSPTGAARCPRWHGAPLH